MGIFKNKSKLKQIKTGLNIKGNKTRKKSRKTA
jgi:hypothetical protein